MRTILTAIIVLAFRAIVFSAEIAVQEPVLTITGHYGVHDGRVKEHKFPVTLQLSGTGEITGTWDSWIEEIIEDGSSQLSFHKYTFKGSWLIQDNTIQIMIDKKTVLPQFSFPEINGLKIKIAKKDS